jgi:predicted TIM-barrel fold metal-dependent hydrolase
MGRERDRQRRGLPPLTSYDEALPVHDVDPAARVGLLDEQGIDEAVVFPNYGLFWVRALEGSPETQLANMEAWNRWAVEGVMSAGRGRLHPVGHVSLRDPEWLDAQLRFLASAGVYMAMVPIGPVEGRAFCDPQLDRCWSAFEHHGVAVMFHISDGPRPFADAWYDGDVNPIEPLLMSTFISVTPMLCLASMAIGGVFERHPALRVGLVEFTSAWFGPFLRSLDGNYRFHADYNGLGLDRLRHRPSEYLKAQVRAATFGFERPEHLTERFGDVFMFGSDYPHAEGLAQPLTDFRSAGGPEPGSPTSALYRDNARWLIAPG